MEPRQIVAGLEQELDASHQRCQQIERAIRSIREIYGIREDGAAPTRAPVKAVEKANGHARATPTAATKKAPAPSERGADVLALIRQHGPLKPRELARRMRIDAAMVSYHAKPLLESGRLAVTGKTNARTFHLPGKPPAKEEP
jgi:DNA-binding CsgD family transcriptional regulator